MSANFDFTWSDTDEEAFTKFASAQVLHKQIMNNEQASPLERCLKMSIFARYLTKCNNFKSAHSFLVAAYTISKTESSKEAKDHVAISTLEYTVKILEESVLKMKQRMSVITDFPLPQVHEAFEPPCEVFQSDVEHRIPCIEENVPISLEVCAKIFALGRQAYFAIKEPRTRKMIARFDDMYKSIISLCHSKSIKTIKDWSRLAKLYKRRIDLISSNPNSFVYSQADLASLFAALLDTKMKIFEAKGGNVDNRFLQKMAYIVNRGIAYYEENLAVLDGEKENRHGEILKIQTRFGMAKLYNKLFSPNRDEQMEYTEMAIENYKKVLEMVAAKPELKHSVTYEVDVCIDVIDLLQKQVKAYRKQEMEKKYKNETQYTDNY